MIDQAHTGRMPASGNIEDANEVIGFSFGTYFDDEGQLLKPGPVNEAMADFIVGNEVLRSKNMTLQEELAVAVQAREPKLGDQISNLPSIKVPFQAFSTHELIAIARPGLQERQVRSLAVIAFRHHQPRATAQVKGAGFEVSTPNMIAIGDFDPHSGQSWIHSREDWIKRERKVIVAHALLNRI